VSLQPQATPPVVPSPLFYGVYVMYINICIFTYVNVQEKNHALTFPRPPIPGCCEMGFACLDQARGASLVKGAF
jgi:hypothetical protein